ncbi:glycine cleavage system protein GcvH [Anaerolinea thermophila]|uniref:Glycine cleavage system H protein n=1 Tax=Anaerolinea thermophila (strain DSM 14523 / JCM 11388 / NBRC 100420 / UNI-1) TaxID=926569 RepID=E8N5J0_ANATU|nr:glycine cleavage system protein GcvH [Anaerolinea thermophila]BAJ63704.1 glycine cleavage system H protein [Anaerolinea thermophila UNI-1]
MNIPAELKYATTDEWVKVEGDVATIGITDYAQDSLSDVVFFEAIVSVGDTIKAKQQIATVESVKAAADINSPVSGEVIAINEALADSPELVNKDPYGTAWMIKVKMSNPSELDNLMDAAGYESYCSGREH